MDKEVFLPVLHWFDAKNSFTGSCGDFRYMVKPNVVMPAPFMLNTGTALSAMKRAKWKGKKPSPCLRTAARHLSNGWKHILNKIIGEGLYPPLFF